MSRRRLWVAYILACTLVLSSLGCVSTVMHRAARRGHAATVGWLLRLQVSPDIRCRGGMTPLMTAVGGGRLGVARRLLEHGASVAVTDDMGMPVHAYAYERQRGDWVRAAGGLPSAGGRHGAGSRTLLVFKPDPRGRFFIYHPATPYQPDRRAMLRLLDERLRVEDAVCALGVFVQRGDLTLVRKTLDEIKTRPDREEVAERIAHTYAYGSLCRTVILSAHPISDLDLLQALPEPGRPVLCATPRDLSRLTTGSSRIELVPAPGGGYFVVL